MIRVKCQGCGSGIRAKDSLRGQIRECPKCGSEIEIVESKKPAESVGNEFGNEIELGRTSPVLFNRQNRYLICDHSHLVAFWENNGRGWMLKSSSGLISAVRNSEKLPNQGDFKLVELRMKTHEGGLRLDDIFVHQLAQRWALTKLQRGDGDVIESVTGPGFLNRDQKAVVYQLLHERFMRPVWEDAAQVLDYLTSTDYHSPGPIPS